MQGEGRATLLGNNSVEALRFRGAMLGLAVGEYVSSAPEVLSASFAAAADAEQRAHELSRCVRVALATALWLIDGEGDEHLATVLKLHEDSPSTFSNDVAYGAVSIGLGFVEPDLARERARALAMKTHLHPIGQDGAGVMAAAIAELTSIPEGSAFGPTDFLFQARGHAHTRRFRDLFEVVRSMPDLSQKTVVRVLGVSTEAHRSIPTALYLFARHHTSFIDTVQFSLGLGADASVTAMAAALSGAWLGEAAIPAHLCAIVDPDRRIRNTADQLFEMHQRRA